MSTELEFVTDAICRYYSDDSGVQNNATYQWFSARYLQYDSNGDTTVLH